MAKKLSARNKPSVSIIGIGRVGQALANALQSVGYPVVALVFRDSAQAKRARKLFSKSTFPDTLLLASDQLESLPASDLLLITTPDDAIEEMAEKVAALPNGGRPNGKPNGKQSAVLHTSGALSSDALAPLSKVGFSVGSIHPLVAIDPAEGAAALRGAFYCIEGRKLAASFAKSIALDLGGTPIRIKTANKALYHAAAVMASPHVVALFDLAVKLMVMSGVEWSDARKMLLPLVDSTVKNLRARAPSSALTGTFARGDIGTVERHLKALSQGSPGDALEVYKLLGLRSLQLAKENGLDPAKVKQITKLLKSKPKKPAKP
ncbi:MAG: DUF2520 domain-containing protein [Pyrinomonadaceae bacterium]|nr:DUF2520 domain-containing protein [Pyrinomonadaceae bacterium]